MNFQINEGYYVILDKLEDKMLRIGRIYISKKQHMKCLEFYSQCMKINKDLTKTPNLHKLLLFRDWIDLFENLANMTPLLQ